MVKPSSTLLAKVKTYTYLALGLTLLVSIMVKPAPASASLNGFGNLFNVATRLCADVPNFKRGRPDGPVNQYRCDYSSRDNQRWRLLSRGQYRGYPQILIQNVEDSLCLDVPGYGKVGPGTRVTEFNCRVADNQVYYARPSGGAYYIINVSSGLCLDVAGHKVKRLDEPLTLAPCSSADDHRWAFASRAVRAVESPSVRRISTLLKVRTRPSVSAPTKHRLASGSKLDVRCWQAAPDGHRWIRIRLGYIRSDFARGLPDFLPSPDLS